MLGWRSRRRCRLHLACFSLGLAGMLGCGPANLEAAREPLQAALEAGDRAEAGRILEGLGPAESAAGVVEIAQAWVQVGEATRASWVLDEGSRRFPDDAPLKLALARVALLLADPSRALRVAEQVPPTSEQHAEALLARAQAELGLGRLEHALTLYDEAERLYPERPESRIARITTLQQEHRFEEALAAVAEARQAITHEDEAAEAARRWLAVTEARLQTRAGEPEAAIASLRRQVAETPEAIPAWQLLVQLLAGQGRGSEAEELVLAALAEDEERYGLYPLVASLHQAAGRTEEADRLLRVLLDRAEGPAPYVSVAQLRGERGELEGALEILEEGLGHFPDDPELRVQRFEYLMIERAEAAAAELDALAERLPSDDPRLDYLRARLRLAEGDAAGAQELLDRLVPRLDRAATQYWLGRSLQAQGDVEGARRRYALALHRDGRWPMPHLALLDLARRRGAWRELASHARALVQLRPGWEAGWLALAEALVQLEEGEAAEAAADRAAALVPEAWQPVVLQARAQRVQGKSEQALATLAEGLEAQPASAEIAAEQALTLGMGGRVGEALAACDAAIEEHPDVARLHVVRASLLYLSDRAAEGDAATERALALAPEDAEALWNRCRFRAATGRAEAGRADCLRVTEQRPEDPETFFVLGAVLASLGEVDGAAAAYRRAAELDERDARPLNNLAMLLRDAGELDEALAAGQRAYRLDPTDAQVLDTVGSLYLDTGLAGRAVSMLEEAHATAPEAPAIRLNLARAYVADGRREEARGHLEALLAGELEDAALRQQAEEARASLQ